MWTVLKGRVYNISPYMRFHPGGMKWFSWVSSLCWPNSYSIICCQFCILIKKFIHVVDICLFLDNKNMNLFLLSTICCLSIFFFSFLEEFLFQVLICWWKQWAKTAHPYLVSFSRFFLFSILFYFLPFSESSDHASMLAVFFWIRDNFYSIQCFGL